MHKFENIKLNDEMYSLVFGLGKVNFVLAKSLRLQDYYVFEVKYDNGQKVFYTTEGKPNWCQDKGNCNMTIYYKNEINFEKVDTKPKKKALKKQKIKALRYEDELDMMSPAGAWIDASLMPDIMVDNALNNKEYHLFRKKQNV